MGLMGTLSPAQCKPLLKRNIRTRCKRELRYCGRSAMIDLCSKGFMSIKNDHKQSPAAVLSSVIAEMAKPRVVESAKRAGGPLVDGEDPINLSVKETPVPRPRPGVTSGRVTDSTSIDAP